MAKHDFNSAIDFASSTMSAPSAVLEALALEKSKWNISEGSYKGGRRDARQVLFHVFRTNAGYQAGLESITDEGGRRSNKIPFPYTDGHTTDDLGSLGEDFDCNVTLHGPAYKQAMNRLLREFNDTIPGTLEHPVRGTIRAKAIHWKIVHHAMAKQAIMLSVQFTTHNFDAAAITDVLIIPSTKSALQSALAALQAIAATLATLKGLVGIVQSLVIEIRQKVADIYGFYQNLLVDSASSFGLGGQDAALVLSINQGGLVAPFASGRTAGGVDGAVDPNAFGGSASTGVTAGIGGTSTTTGGFIRVSDRFTTVVAPADPFANLPIDLLGDIAREAIEQTQLAGRADTMRAMANETLMDIDTAIEGARTTGVASAGTASAGILNLLSAKESLLSACDAAASLLRSGSSNGRPVIVNYRVPRPMSIREVAFLNALTADDGNDIALLNPAIESVNYIEKDTVLKVPTFL